MPEGKEERGSRGGAKGWVGWREIFEMEESPFREDRLNLLMCTVSSCIYGIKIWFDISSTY
jgi:hypothetical protein